MKEDIEAFDLFRLHKYEEKELTKQKRKEKVLMFLIFALSFFVGFFAVKIIGGLV